MHKPQSPLAMWGGIECTINRVGDIYFDQLDRVGHLENIERDLACVAELGIRTLRTSLHWERFATRQAAGEDPWQIFDRVMDAHQAYGIRPIVGLVHHGSGPERTSLLDPDFAEKLADYAFEVARRYPWVTAYTPVNEPNTTARFSCLYTHWYPHHRSMPSYLRALVEQVKATALCMQAIRTVQPNAELITTEDGGRVSGAEALEQEVALREDRRWLGTDLLCGRVTANHPLFDYLCLSGITPDELGWFEANRCPPDVLGLNYYLTSDRFLDDRLHCYPKYLAGGDTGDQPLVDIEALRVCPEGITGAADILTDAWQRYRIPVAITECHLGDAAPNQIRWLSEVWRGSLQARTAGVDVRAVTAWALLGSHNWCNLCTHDSRSYEPGAFSTRDGSGRPEPTRLASVIRDLASGVEPGDREWREAGWWQSDDRLLYPAPEELWLKPVAGRQSLLWPSGDSETLADLR